MDLTGVALIRAKRGMMTQLAAELGIHRSAVMMWKKIPAERVPDVERITGIPRHLLRPDLHIAPSDTVKVA